MPSRSKVCRTAVGDISILLWQELVATLDDRDTAAETAVHLRELDTLEPTADDQQMLREGIQFEDGFVRQRLHIAQSRKSGHNWASASVDDHMLAYEGAAAAIAQANLYRLLADEMRLAQHELEAGCSGEQLVVAAAHEADNRSLAFAHGGHIDPGEFSADAIVACPAHHRGDLCALDERLGRDAGDVDAGATDHLRVAFDQGRLVPLLRHIHREGLATFATTDDHQIELFLRVHSALLRQLAVHSTLSLPL